MQGKGQRVNLGCAILVLGMLAGLAAVLWVSRQPVVSKQPWRAIVTLVIAIGLVWIAIVSAALLISGGAVSVDDCGIFVFGPFPAHAVLSLVLFAGHDRVSTSRFNWLVVSSFAASLIVPVAVMTAWYQRSIDGPALFGLALTSSIPSMPYIGFGLALPVVAFVTVDRIRPRVLATAVREDNR